MNKKAYGIYRQTATSESLLAVYENEDECIDAIKHLKAYGERGVIGKYFYKAVEYVPAYIRREQGCR